MLSIASFGFCNLCSWTSGYELQETMIQSRLAIETLKFKLSFTFSVSIALPIVYFCPSRLRPIIWLDYSKNCWLTFKFHIRLNEVYLNLTYSSYCSGCQWNLILQLNILVWKVDWPLSVFPILLLSKQIASHHLIRL